MTGAESPGDRDRYCSARKRQGTGNCHRPAGWGTTHPGTGRCKLHGGNTPDHNTAAKMEIARRAVVTYGLPREVAPDVALLEEVHRSAGHVEWLAGVVAAMEPKDLVWGITEQVDKQATEFGGVDTTHKAVPNVWLTLYQQERKHLADVCKAALAAGIAERQVKLAEQQGALMAEAVRRIADGLLAAVLHLLDEELQHKAATAVRQQWPAWLGDIVPRELRAVAG